MGGKFPPPGNIPNLRFQKSAHLVEVIWLDPYMTRFENDLLNILLQIGLRLILHFNRWQYVQVLPNSVYTLHGHLVRVKEMFT